MYTSMYTNQQRQKNDIDTDHRNKETQVLRHNFPPLFMTTGNKWKTTE